MNAPNALDACDLSFRMRASAPTHCTVQRAVGQKRLGRVIAMKSTRRHKLGQGTGIFQGAVHILPKIRTHSMIGITHQNDPPSNIRLERFVNGDRSEARDLSY
ncbi:hypothetical protein, variant 6 [Aphanomyces astaci]|uniref:Uncharacterized protein n=1 Tax=Aphanomyces astaci TaxID=112090 RepID=W4FQ66_APHAT|nr:hypothetical protein H257_15382 [Aphanomyces astaci]XP_009841777.1 hypothetical protein, variant 1 [Aphanomyces astaci]XP_009841778.1 hypothetical protein, variant 2 [Aphanomyces astaci]XP_009841779.1 hypothetical protein, variant 3 [Aphanomyces astaci]XP_009841780.1 hypothetical protein, variant 4 [Aphanomyces astaci]XP_009841781.1 hypothetical protein, variant 5 [Aphanomyces astaci]XP_009841782.1 hypothetical protein, variant 6 [Aphanomyces astaci]ETV68822.1 hypothetical protein H257_15|eukprot:XP_009841776.1 hypothetical protein H257_15382 [Aphanomyces astaci]